MRARSIRHIISNIFVSPLLIRIFLIFRPRRFFLLFLSFFSRFIIPPAGIIVRIASGSGKNLKMLLRIGSKFNQQETFYWLGIAESSVQRLFVKLINPGFIVYDIGAYLGFYSLLAGRLVKPEGRVYAFEPLPANIERIKFNIALNNFDGIVFCITKAVTDKNSKAIFNDFGRDDWGRLFNPAFFKDNASAERKALLVETISLDEFVFQEDYPAPNLIKIDVEGEEARVLMGASRLLREHKPIIICELHNFQSAQEAYGVLMRLGYDCKPWQKRKTDSIYGHIIALPKHPRFSKSI